MYFEWSCQKQKNVYYCLLFTKKVYGKNWKNSQWNFIHYTSGYVILMINIITYY